MRLGEWETREDGTVVDARLRVRGERSSTPQHLGDFVRCLHAAHARGEVVVLGQDPGTGFTPCTPSQPLSVRVDAASAAAIGEAVAKAMRAPVDKHEWLPVAELVALREVAEAVDSCTRGPWMTPGPILQAMNRLDATRSKKP